MIVKKIISDIGILEKYRDIIQKTETIRSLGSVTEVTGNVIFSKGPDVRLGELCHIEINTNELKHVSEKNADSELYVLAEVVGFRENKVILSPLESITGVYPGSRVVSTGHLPSVSLTPNVLGRIIDGIGRPIDGKGMLVEGERRSLYNTPPDPLGRPFIRQALPTGVKAIDSLLTIGRGQRIGIFAGSGVGKSTLLGMMGRYSSADVNVIGLIGERGREVSEFINNELGESGMRKSVVVVASSNESPMNRVRAGYLVTTIAEYFRDMGKNVLLMMDSVTRLALAQREVGLSRGEPATTRGYPPSVFSLLPQLMERAGNNVLGSITAFYTVLVEADDMNEPIADAVRGILDGHIVLSRKLASRGQYPAIEITDSISRVMPQVTTKEHQQMAAAIKELVAAYQENEEVINLGAYQRGSSQAIDNAILLRDPLRKFLKQEMDESLPFEDSIKHLKDLVGQIRQSRAAIPVRRGVS